MGKMIKKYCADFETTSGKYYKKHGDVKVWLWGFTRWNPAKETEHKRYKVGERIEDFFYEISQLNNNSIVFFHNLSWDGYFMLCKVKENAYIKKWKYLMSPSLQIYTMSITFHNKKTIRFQCTALLLGYLSIDKMGKILGKEKLDMEYDKEDYTPDALDIKYLKRDIRIMVDYMTLDYKNNAESRFKKNRIKLTLASYSLAQFKKQIKPHNHNYLWQNHLSVKEWDMIYKYSTFGGLSVYKGKYKNQILGKAIYYDLNSSYPDKYINYPLPWGAPLSERPTGKYFALYFIRVYEAKKIDLEMPDHLHSKTHANKKMKSLRYFKDIKDINGFTIGYWDFELEEIKKTYKLKYKVLRIMYFKQTWVMRKPGLELYKNKENAKTEVERKGCKDILNTWYGKMGQKRKQYDVKCVDYTNMVFEKTASYETNTAKLSYIPVTSIIAARGRVDLLRNIRRNKKNWVYSDTDSMILLGDKSEHIGIKLDKKKLGYWDIENEIIRFKYLRSKAYLLETKKGKKFVNAGLNNFSPDKVKLEDYGYGFGVKAEEGVKLSKKRYENGYILEFTSWTIGQPAPQGEEVKTGTIITKN